MVLEMKRALEDLKTGDRQGYRKLYDAACQEVYCRSFLILQEEEQAEEFTKGFFGELFKSLDPSEGGAGAEKWFWQKYYQYLRRQYRRLLENEKKEAPGVKNLAKIPASFPLLHRVMLVMSYMDEFAADEVSAVFGIEEAKIKSELDKLEKYLPSLAKGQPESVSSYLANWRVLLMGASRQILSGLSGERMERIFSAAATEAGIVMEAQPRKDSFDYFVADVELSDLQPEKEERPKKKVVPVPVAEEEEEEEYEDDEYDEEEYEDDEYEDEDDEDDDGRYDWDLEDDGRKMVILGAILALVIVVLVGFGAYKFLNRDEGEPGEQPVTEQEDEDGEASLIIKGDGEADGEEEEEAPPEEEPEEAPEEPPAEEEPAEEPEPEIYVMEVTGSSVNIRSESNTDSEIVTKVTSGERVEVLSDPAAEWVQVRCTEQNNEEGYMKTEYLTDVE